MLCYSTRTAYIFAVESLPLSLELNPIPSPPCSSAGRRENGTGKWVSSSSRCTPPCKVSALVTGEGGRGEMAPEGQPPQATHPGDSNSMSNKFKAHKADFQRAARPPPAPWGFLLSRSGGLKIRIFNQRSGDADAVVPGPYLERHWSNRC